MSNENKPIEKIIDIEAILRQKLGNRMRFVPRFLVSWLKHIAHEDLVNQCLTEHKEKRGVEWIDGCVDFLGMQLTVKGRENLPAADDAQRYTFVSNHPLGGIDGLALGSIIGHQYNGQFRYLVNDLLHFLPGFADLSVGINKTGKQGRDFPKRVEEVFSSQYHVLMFPAGLCSRRINGEIHDIPWTKTFITKSIQHQRHIVPIHFSGQNSTFFYRLANVCKALKIKFNIAMLFLVDEMYKNMNKPFTITIGKPIPWQTFDHSKTPIEWAQWVEDKVYELNK